MSNTQTRSELIRENRELEEELQTLELRRENRKLKAEIERLKTGKPKGFKDRMDTWAIVAGVVSVAMSAAFAFGTLYVIYHIAKAWIAA